MRSMSMILFLCLAAMPAEAQLPFATPVGSDAEIEGSKTFFYAGESYYKTGDYEQAFENFAKAWDLAKNPAYAYDAALAAWRCDAPFRARTWLRRVPCDHPGYAQLAARVVTAIDEDDKAWGRVFACDEARRVCGWSTYNERKKVTSFRQ